MSLVHRGMENGCHVWEGSAHAILLDRVYSKAFRLISSSPSTDCLQSLNSVGMLHPFLPSICFSMLTAHLILMIVCLHAIMRPRCTLLSTYVHRILSKPLMQEVSGTYILSSLTMVNSGTVFPYLYFTLPATWIFGRGRL